MFGIDSSGFIIIMIVALIVIGPERMPGIMAKLGKFMGQMRAMTNDVKRSFQVEFERAELEKRKAEAMKELFPEDEAAQAEAQASAESEMAVEQAELADAKADQPPQAEPAAAVPPSQQPTSAQAAAAPQPDKPIAPAQSAQSAATTASPASPPSKEA